MLCNHRDMDLAYSDQPQSHLLFGDRFVPSDQCGTLTKWPHPSVVCCCHQDSRGGQLVTTARGGNISIPVHFWQRAFPGAGEMDLTVQLKVFKDETLVAGAPEHTAADCSQPHCTRHYCLPGSTAGHDLVPQTALAPGTVCQHTVLLSGSGRSGSSYTSHVTQVSLHVSVNSCSMLSHVLRDAACRA